jgi:hypothetical protein
MSEAVAPMSDAGAARAPRSGVRQPKTSLPSITIDGRTWDSRKKLAAELGICDASLKRMNVPTTYIGGVAYVCREESLREISSRARRRNEAPRETPPVRRRLRR